MGMNSGSWITVVAPNHPDACSLQFRLFIYISLKAQIIYWLVARNPSNEAGKGASLV
jgi:hypothetical protein